MEEYRIYIYNNAILTKLTRWKKLHKAGSLREAIANIEWLKEKNSSYKAKQFVITFHWAAYKSIIVKIIN